MTAAFADRPRSITAWFWPPPPIARRLWPAIAASTVYAEGIYLLFPADPIASAQWLTVVGIINGIVLGSLVAFRTKAAFDRWWEGRILWGKLVNDTRNLCLKAVALADPPADDRQELYRLAAGFPVALMRSLRGPNKLREVPGFEADPADPAHVTSHIAGRVFALLERWRRDGRLDGHARQVIDPHAAAFMDVAGACERIRNTPLPASYLSLIRHGLILGFLLLPWHLIHTLGVWALPFQAVIVYFLFGVELIAEEQENPFGFDGDDLPLERYCETIRGNVREILGGGEKCS
jgi:putative membrane protein